MAFKAPIKDPNPNPAADEVANLDVQSPDMVNGGNDYESVASYLDCGVSQPRARGGLEACAREVAGRERGMTRTGTCGRAAGHCAEPDRRGGVFAAQSSSVLAILPNCLPIDMLQDQVAFPNMPNPDRQNSLQEASVTKSERDASPLAGHTQ